MTERPTTVLTDAAGRKLTVRTLSVLDQARLMRAIGAEQSRNEPYVHVVQVAASVAEIDGMPMPFPTNERQIDGAIGRIGDEGFAAITVYLRKQIDDTMAAAEAAADGEEKRPDPLDVSAR